MEDLENHKYLSFFECVDGGGDVLLNMFILSRKQHLEKQVEENNLDDNVTLAVNDNDYSNNEISHEWLEHFDQHTKKIEKRIAYNYNRSS